MNAIQRAINTLNIWKTSFYFYESWEDDDEQTIQALKEYQKNSDWIRTNERLPTKEDADHNLNVWVHGYTSTGNPIIKLWDYRGVDHDPQYSVYWKRTNLQPILKNQEGER